MISRDMKGSETTPVPKLLSSVAQSGSATGPFYVSVIVTLKGTATNFSHSQYRVPAHTEKEEHFSSSQTVQSRRSVKSGIPLHAPWI